MSATDDRSVETTSSEKSSYGNDDTTTDPVVVMAVVELDGLFDDGNSHEHNTLSTNDNTFITKIRIYRSELVTTDGAMSQSNNPLPLTSYTYTAQQLRNKIHCHFAGRIMISSAGLTQKDTATRIFGETGDEGYYCITVYNYSTSEYIPLPDDDTTNVIPLFGTRWRIRVVYSGNKNDCGGTNQVEKTSAPFLAIQGRYFHDDIQVDGTITVGEYKLQVLPPLSTLPTADAHASTGYHVWDGALLLIRYLEGSMNQLEFVDQHVIELGSGCGIVGMTAALLGAKSVTLTDLPELLPFAQSNVDTNMTTIRFAREQQSISSSDHIIRCESCDWADPLSSTIQSKMYNYILVADCIWIESLVRPLFATLRALTDIETTHRQSMRKSLILDDLNKISNRLPETIVEDKVTASVNASISYMDLNKSKTSMDESPVNSNADIYHNQSSQLQLSGLVDPQSTIRQVENNSKQIASTSSLVDEQQELRTNDPIQHPPSNHSSIVLISYQRRGKSTHDTFIKELYELFTVIETITVPNLNYPPDIFSLYLCRR